MSNSYLNISLSKLEIDKNIIEKLNKNNIYEIKELCSLKRKDLKELGLTDQEIKHITIKLQLHSIDLNNKIYCKK